MVITASIVTHLTPAGQLTTALECLLRSEVKRIYVVDNSPDDSLRGVAGAYGRVEYMHVENRGFGEGHNLAIRNALADPDGFHLVMNADVWWDGDIIAPLLRYLKDNPSVGMVAPKVYYPDGVLQYSCRMLPTPLDLFAKRFLPSFLSRHRMDRYLLAGHDHDFPLDCPYLLGSFLLFPQQGPARLRTLRRTFLHVSGRHRHHPAHSSTVGHHVLARGQYCPRACSCISQEPEDASHPPLQHDTLFQQMGMVDRRQSSPIQSPLAERDCSDTGIPPA